MDLVLKSAHIADFCNTSSRFMDFDNTVDHRLAENFVLDSGTFMSGGLDRRLVSL